MICELRRTAADVRGVAWTSQHRPDGAVSWICPACTRAQLFEIESGLPLTAPAPARRAA